MDAMEEIGFSTRKPSTNNSSRGSNGRYQGGGENSRPVNPPPLSELPDFDSPVEDGMPAVMMFFCVTGAGQIFYAGTYEQ